MDFRLMTAPCGLDCFNCPMFRAGRDPELREKIAHSLGLPLEAAQCPGCRPEGGIIKFMGWTEPCGVYRCISEKGLDFCCDCSDFPCDRLHPYADRAGEVPHNTKVFNLGLIKKMGLEAWAENKAAEVKKTYFKGKFHL
ncbi:MAG: DUF3795 domain-containing protein [Thermodesulfobacteriota bacterium]